MGKLDGKVAIVTGGASGIGKRTAELFVEEGARVIIADLNGEGVAAMVAQLGDKCADGLELDVRDEEAVSRMVDQAFRRFGRLDIAFNNAGIGGFWPIHLYPLENWEQIVSVCLTGTFLCIKQEAARLIAQGQGGSIINVASVNGIQPAEGFAAYCAAKGGVIMLTKVAALELGRHRIRVNGIGPGIVQTPLTEFLLTVPGIEDGFVQEAPIGRVGEPEDVARLALYLASNESEWLTGQTLLIDGGLTLKKYPEMFSYFRL